MKKLHFYFTLTVALFLCASVSANAKGKYGKGSIRFDVIVYSDIEKS